MEPVTVGHHASLDRRWRGHAVPGPRQGGQRGGRRGRRRPAAADDTDADLHVSPEAGAGAADGGVPGVELREGDPVSIQYVLAPLTYVDEVELVAVVYHAGMDKGGGGDPVSGRRRRRGAWGWAIYGADADVDVCPEASAGAADGGVPERREMWLGSFVGSFIKEGRNVFNLHK